jgi:two-component system, OmpR family, response regulator
LCKELIVKLLALLTGSLLQRFIADTFRSDQLVLEIASSPKECILFANHARYDAILVDSTTILFDDVVELVNTLRQADSAAAIFVLARYWDVTQRLRLFEAGVDDCLCEPFIGPEVRALLGRSVRLRQGASASGELDKVNVLRCGDLELNLARWTAMRSGKMISLRPKEFLLLGYLVRNANRPVTRTMILEQVWSSSFEGLTNIVDVYISALRSKLDSDYPEKLIQTIRGVGYVFICLGTGSALPAE